MASTNALLCAILVLACVAVSSAAAPVAASSPLWPQPASASLGTSVVQLAPAFAFATAAKSDLLGRAIARYTALLAVPRSAAAAAPSQVAAAPLLASCTVLVETVLATAAAERASLRLEKMNETYALTVAADATACTIHANTVWGALRGLETFAQLFTRDTSSAKAAGAVSTALAPIAIADSPRFAHRGLLIDTARHFLPVATIQALLDTLPAAKLNMLHWHMVDAQSFPFDAPSAPTLSQGAYAPSLRYSLADVGAVASYAADRGVQLIVEIDVPGHAASWRAGRPDLIPAGCPQRYDYNINNWALNPTLDATYEALEAVLSDVMKAVGGTAQFLHIGGDEVVYGCWRTDPTIAAWMAANGFAAGDYDALLAYFVKRADAIVQKLGAQPMHWEEVFLAGAQMPTGGVYTVWTNSTRVEQLTAARQIVVAMPSDYWYLDHPTSTWDVMWSYDPTRTLTAAQAAFVIGGEAAMWGELVDAANLMPKIWPTAAAVAERLWSPAQPRAPTTSPAAISQEVAESQSQLMDALTRADAQVATAAAAAAAELNVLPTAPPNPRLDEARARLNVFRCRLVARGVAAAPIGPGFCAPEFAYV